MTRRRSGIGIAAALPDAVALAGLVLIAVGSFLGFDPGLGLVLLGALMGITVVPGLVLSCVWVCTRLRRRGVRRAGVAAVLTLSVIAAVAAGPGVAILFSGLTPNPAADRLQPVVDELRAEGGARVCDDTGDPGLGPDNLRPSEGVTYRVPDRPGLRQRLERTARRAHLVSSPDPDGLQFSIGIAPAGRPACCGLRRVAGARAGYAVVTAQLQLPVRAGMA